MQRNLVLAACLAGFALSAAAQELTWRKDIKPIVDAKCAGCHGANAPDYWEWMLLPNRDKVAPRLNGQVYFMSHVVWPATGSIMRRLDDGKASGGKPGNMYSFLGSTDAERAKNQATIKTWIGGNEAWNLNRWEARGKTPGITKQQLDKIKAKY